jgi:hypothetical protein
VKAALAVRTRTATSAHSGLYYYHVLLVNCQSNPSSLVFASAFCKTGTEIEVQVGRSRPNVLWCALHQVPV